MTTVDWEAQTIPSSPAVGACIVSLLAYHPLVAVTVLENIWKMQTTYSCVKETSSSAKSLIASGIEHTPEWVGSFKTIVTTWLSFDLPSGSQAKRPCMRKPIGKPGSLAGKRPLRTSDGRPDDGMLHLSLRSQQRKDWMQAKTGPCQRRRSTASRADQSWGIEPAPKVLHNLNHFQSSPPHMYTAPHAVHSTWTRSESNVRSNGDRFRDLLLLLWLARMLNGFLQRQCHDMSRSVLIILNNFEKRSEKASSTALVTKLHSCRACENCYVSTNTKWESLLRTLDFFLPVITLWK